MDRRTIFLIGAASLFCAQALAPRPARAGGFLLYEQAAKPSALGGAFVAQADDPSAMFYNVGGLALLGPKPKVTAGLSLYSRNQAIFQGLAPGRAAGTNGEQESAITPLIHAYAVLPVSERIKAGMGIYQPFLLKTEWAAKDTFAGRHLALDAEIGAIDLNPSIAYKATAKLGIGLGVVYRLSDLSLQRRVQVLNPFTGKITDFASEAIDTSMEGGLGWNVGILHRATKRFSWGLAYRSEIEIDYAGEGRFTQISTGNDQLDDLLRATTPFDLDLGVTSNVVFPDLLTVGIAVRVAKKAVVELDLVQTGWSSFERLDIVYPANVDRNDSLPQRFIDSDSVRIGVRLRSKSGSELRFGLALDESPQPDETVGPLIADADRTSFTVGVGKEPLDLTFVWTDFDRRTTTNVDGFNGNYAGNTWLLALTVSK